MSRGRMESSLLHLPLASSFSQFPTSCTAARGTFEKNTVDIRFCLTIKPALLKVASMLVAFCDGVPASFSAPSSPTPLHFQPLCSFCLECLTPCTYTCFLLTPGLRSDG